MRNTKSQTEQDHVQVSTPDFLIQVAETLRKEQEYAAHLEQEHNDLCEQVCRGTTFKQVKAIKWLPEYFVKSDGMYREIGKQLSNKSHQMDKEVIAFESTQYGTINLYHVDVINAFHEEVENDPDLLVKYRKETI